MTWHMLADLNIEDPGDLSVYNFSGADSDFITLSSGNKKISTLH